jgi:hypothetical protein
VTISEVFFWLAENVDIWWRFGVGALGAFACACLWYFAAAWEGFK